MDGGKQILLVEGDAVLRQSLLEQLALNKEFETTALSTGVGALNASKIQRYDLLILSVGLPDINGHELCQLLRRGHVHAPIILLEDSDSQPDTILPTNNGATNYILKPFRLGVLLECIRAHLRRQERSEEALFDLGPYSFHPAAKLLLLTDTNDPIRLTEKEAAILKYLLESSSSVVGRRELLDEIWGYNSGVTTHTLETHIYRLRQKLERDPPNAEILVTETGGYRLIP